MPGNFGDILGGGFGGILAGVFTSDSNQYIWNGKNLKQNRRRKIEHKTESKDSGQIFL